MSKMITWKYFDMCYGGTTMSVSNKYLYCVLVLPVYLTCFANELFMVTCQGNQCFSYAVMLLQQKEIKSFCCLRFLIVFFWSNRYTCCGGYMPCSGRCGESKCPELCLATEVRDYLPPCVYVLCSFICRAGTLWSSSFSPLCTSFLLISM